MSVYVHRTVALDPSQLAAPFELQTRWHVLTGAACCGKTTLLEMLAAWGYAVIPETARDFFTSEMAKGRMLDEILKDRIALQYDILALQREYEDGFAADCVTFLDRAVPDSLAFFRVHGGNPNAILPECFHRRYASVFILDRLPLHRKQTLGPEDDANSNFLDQWLERDYQALGYAVLRVPVLSPEERLEFILEKIGGQGGISYTDAELK
jgi:predicted ATPase